MLRHMLFFRCATKSSAAFIAASDVLLALIVYAIVQIATKPVDSTAIVGSQMALDLVHGFGCFAL